MLEETCKWLPGFRAGSGKESTCRCRRCRRWGFDPGAGKIPWRRKWQPTPVFLPGESHGRRSLAGYSPWGCRESDSEWLSTCKCVPFPPYSRVERWRNQVDERESSSFTLGWKHWRPRVRHACNEGDSHPLHPQAAQETCRQDGEAQLKAEFLRYRQIPEGADAAAEPCTSSSFSLNRWFSEFGSRFPKVKTTFVITVRHYLHFHSLSFKSVRWNFPRLHTCYCQWLIWEFIYLS